MPLATAKFRIPRLSDRHVVEALNAIVQEGEFGSFSLSATLLYNGGERHLKPGQDSNIDDVLSLDTIAIQQFSVTINNWTVLVSRPTDNSSPKDAEDTVSVAPGQGEHNFIQFAQLIGLARRHLRAIDGKPFLDHIREDDKAYYLAREDSLRRLQEMQDDFFRRIQEHTVELDNRYHNRIAQLDRDFAARHEKLTKEHEQNIAEVKTKDDELEALRKKFDDRDSKHVRRELQEQLHQKIEARRAQFELTPGTRRKYRMMFAVYVALLSLFGGAAAYFIVNAKDQTALQVETIIRQVVFSVLFGITAALFLRWNNSWFKSHADEEFRFNRMQLDLVRASWVFEVALEWQGEKGAEMPPALIDRLSRNLFNDAPTDDSSMTAADAVASAVFGSATSATFRSGDNEFTLDRKGIQTLKKSDIA